MKLKKPYKTRRGIVQHKNLLMLQSEMKVGGGEVISVQTSGANLHVVTVGRRCQSKGSDSESATCIQKQIQADLKQRNRA